MSQGGDSRCQWCAEAPAHPKDKCWSTKMTCHYCKVTGHISKACIKQKKDQKERAKKNDKNVSSIFCGSVKNDDAVCDISPITVEVWNEKNKYKGWVPKVLPDTGAGANLMGVEEAKRIGPIRKGRSGVTLTAANGLPITSIGILRTKIRYGKVRKEVNFIVTDEYKGIIMNRQACKDFKLIPKDWPSISTQVASVKEEQMFQNAKEQLRLAPELCLGADDHKYDVASKEFREIILRDYADVFDGDKPLEPMEGPPMKIHLKPDAVPTQVTKPRPIPLPLQEPARKMLKKEVQRGVISEVTEPRE